uniref:Uncharacterized protein n=1 Tax=Romanomermis culicivorax TaxID=13658 RepID=A0A915IRZ0_ROMCU
MAAKTSHRRVDPGKKRFKLAYSLSNPKRSLQDDSELHPRSNRFPKLPNTPQGVETGGVTALPGIIKSMGVFTTTKCLAIELENPGVGGGSPIGRRFLEHKLNLKELSTLQKKGVDKNY